MKKLVRIVAPSNYIHKGREIFVNPNDVTSVSHSNEGHVIVKLSTGETACSDDCISKVIADIEAAL